MVKNDILKICLFCIEFRVLKLAWLVNDHENWHASTFCYAVKTCPGSIGWTIGKIVVNRFSWSWGFENWLALMSLMLPSYWFYSAPVIFSCLFICTWECWMKRGWCRKVIIELKLMSLFPFCLCRISTVGGTPLDLHRLFVEVTSRGGIEKVCIAYIILY